MTAYDHRLRAREALKGNWPMAALITLIASVLGGVSGSNGIDINLNLFSESIGSAADLTGSIGPEWVGALLGILGIFAVAATVIALVVAIVLFVIGSPISLGYHRHALNLLDRQESGVGTLFSQFHRLGDALTMNLFRAFLIFLGTLLLFVPGIILSYSYAMADFILLEDPNCSGSEALRRSRAMMRGHKWDLFMLRLSFIGWSLLAAFTGGIGNLFLTPYTTVATASFYRELLGGGRQAIDDGYITVE